MHVTVTGKNIELTKALKEYLVDKLNRAQKHFEHPLEAIAILSVSKNPSMSNNQTAEVTIKINGSIIRGEESTENMYASIDLVADKIERQLRKFKTKYSQKPSKIKDLKQLEPYEASIEDDEDEFDINSIELKTVNPNKVELMPKIVRSKRYPLKPLTPEEAVKHMEVLGHEFFMFINKESKQVNTVYTRKDGNFELIEPEI